MIRPDYRDFRTRSKSFRHSSEGSECEEHKYIKRIDGPYYYPDSYEGGRHLPKGSKFGEYTKGDPDFDDKNFDEKNRLGDTDFFGFKREDGTYVILEEIRAFVTSSRTAKRSGELSSTFSLERV